MGCFSFLCKVSGKPALSTSFGGSACKLYLLKGGKVVEMMHGNYDSYGRVFKNGTSKEHTNELCDSFEWKMSWDSICSLMFDPDDSNGIAMVLDLYDNGEIPTTRSEDDPDQGWGSSELFADCSADGFERVENPYHKVFTEEV